MPNLALAVLLEANAAGFNRGMQSAQHASQHMARSVERDLSLLRKSADVAGAAGFGGLERSISKIAGLSAMGAFGGIVAGAGMAKDALLGVGQAMYEFIRGGEEIIQVQQRFARQFAISGQEAAGLLFAADRVGLNRDVLHRGLGEFSRRLGEAVRGSQEAQQTFRDLRLDFNNLNTMPANLALGQYMDAVNRIPDVNQRAAIHNRVLGESYRELLPLLQRNADFLQSSQHQAAAAGLGHDHEAARLAQQRHNEINASVRAAREGMQARAASSELWQAIRNAPDLLATSWLSAFEAISASVEGRLSNDLGARGLQERLANLTGSGDAFRALVDAETRRNELARPLARDLISLETEILQLTRARAPLNQEEIDSLQERVTLRLAELEAAHRNNAVTEDHLAVVSNIRRELERWQQTQDLIDLSLREARQAEFDAMNEWLGQQVEVGRRFGESLQGPLEVFQNRLADINWWHDIGALDTDQVALATQQAFRQLEQSMGGREVGLASALRRGSAEAVSAVNQFNVNNETPQQRLANLQQEALRIQQMQLDEARQLRAEIERLRQEQQQGVGPL